MSRMLRADLYRLWRSASFWLALGGMLALALAFLIMQGTAMDYTVPLSRVIFLPLSMYGAAMAAFVSVFAGTDFRDGMIRQKMLSAGHRYHCVLSAVLISCGACVFFYAFVTALAAGLGWFFFPVNITARDFVRYFFLGLSMSLVTGCLFCVMTMLCQNKVRAVTLCMGSAFGMLFLSLHTNSVLVQPEYKNGALNPHYAGGLRRTVYGLLHDLNPVGQAAQLSSWEVYHPWRILVLNALLFLGLTVLGCALFERIDLE